jgi:hypothetical protein
MGKEWRNGQKRADKLHASMAARIPKSWPADMGKGFLNKVVGAVVTAYASVPPPKARAPRMACQVLVHTFKNRFLVSGWPLELCAPVLSLGKSLLSICKPVTGFRCEF